MSLAQLIRGKFGPAEAALESAAKRGELAATSAIGLALLIAISMPVLPITVMADEAWSPSVTQGTPKAQAKQPDHAEPVAEPPLPPAAALPPGLQDMPMRPTGPRTFLGREHPGKVTSLSDEGVVVNLRNGGTQVVQFSEIWRVRKAFASDEPPGTTVIDYATTRLFVASPFDSFVADLGKKVPMTKLTAPNGEIIYIVATKVTDISNAIPGLHHSASRAVIGTRDGSQQVLEPVEEAKKMIASAQLMQ